MAASEPEVAVPWEFRIGQLLPVPAVVLGGLIALVLAAAFLVFGWALGFSISGPAGTLSLSARNSLYMALLVGYVFASLRSGFTSIEHDLRLAGFEQQSVTGQLPVETVHFSRYVGSACVLAGFVLVGLSDRMQGAAPTASWTELHDFSFGLWMLLLVCWVIGRAACFTIRGSRFAAEAISGEIAVDLLDVRPLRIFGRIGLRFALLWLVGLAIGTPLLVGPDFEVSGLLGALAVGGAIASVALLIPVLGVRRRISAEKEAELTRVAAAIAGDPTALEGTRIGRRSQEPGLSDLIAYRGLVEAVPEWPYDTTTLYRFLLYLLIPLGSWFAAAFVERLVDALLQ